jgi:sensor c-di-GMP phosphodiesterase-like protein
VQRLVIEQALRRALERGELWLEYQPEVSLETGRVVGAEALLRWDHPTLGALPPVTAGAQAAASAAADAVTRNDRRDIR